MTDSQPLVLHSFEKVTTAQGIDVLKRTLERYIAVLEKIIDIKVQNPVAPAETFIRRKAGGSSTQVLNDLLSLCANLFKDILQVEKNLQHMPTGKEDSPTLNQQLVSLLDNTISECQRIYSGQAQTFAILLNDLTTMTQMLRQKMIFEESTSTSWEEHHGKTSSALKEGQKLVYIRVYHRELPKLTQKKAAVSFFKPLIEMVKHAERHGLAVYDEDTFAEKSLKNDAYGYFTVCIDSTQDISHERAPKEDPALGCRLLTLSKVDPQQLQEFSHNGIHYAIVDGVIQGLGA